MVEAEVQVDLCGHGPEEDQDRLDVDKDNSMEAILITTQLKEEVSISLLIRWDKLFLVK